MHIQYYYCVRVLFPIFIFTQIQHSSPYFFHLAMHLISRSLESIPILFYAASVTSILHTCNLCFKPTGPQAQTFC